MRCYVVYITFIAAGASCGIDENVARTIEDLTKNLQGLGVCILLYTH